MTKYISSYTTAVTDQGWRIASATHMVHPAVRWWRRLRAQVGFWIAGWSPEGDLDGPSELLARQLRHIVKSGFQVRMVTGRKSEIYGTLSHCFIYRNDVDPDKPGVRHMGAGDSDTSLEHAVMLAEEMAVDNYNARVRLGEMEGATVPAVGSRYDMSRDAYRNG